jgi:hypothetical protein
MPLASIVDALSPYSAVIYPAIFFGIFVAAALAFYHRTNWTRQGFLAVFFTSLLVVTILGTAIPPIGAMHKFSSVAAEEEVIYDIRMVDQNGREISYDARAAPPFPGSRINPIAEEMIYRMDAPQRDDTAQHLYTNAKEYREYIESDPVVRSDRVEFPRHGFDYRWDDDTLNDYDEFTTLRIYERHLSYTDDGSDLDEYSEVAIYEWTPESGGHIYER